MYPLYFEGRKSARRSIPSDLCYKITPHSDILWQRSRGAAFFDREY